MDNLTFTNNILLVEGLKVTSPSSYPIFILLFLFYVFAMGCNIGLIILITTEKSLHHPMHFLFCNLPVNDIIGTTVILPRLIDDIFRPTSERYVTYVECVIQAYFVHIFATASHTALVTMAYDRQVAICNPLLYAAIMTDKMVVKLSAIAWALPVIVVAVMIGLTVRLTRCRSKIENPFCDNASLYKLSCENVTINNMFGIVYSVAALIISVTLMVVAYARIVTVCIISKSKALNSKAIRTCSSHIVVYLIMFISCAIMIFFHRFPEYSENRKIASIMFHIVPPGLNPIVYGLQTKEIRQIVVKLWKKGAVNSLS